MVKYKIIFDKNTCTGALSCSGINPDLWVPDKEGKVDLVGAKETSKGIFELELDEEGYEKNKDAVTVCPPGAIKIEKVE